MTRFTQLLHSSALALVASAPSAFADVTAEDVWGQWKTYMSQGGQTLSVGSEVKSGDTLTITDLQMAMDMPEGGMNATLSTLSFKENGDGTVTITLPPEYPIALTMRPAGQPEGKMDLLVTQTEVTTIASGAPANISYAIAGKEMAVALEAVETGGDQPVDMTMRFVIGGISGNYNVVAGDPMTFTSAANAATIGIDMDVKDPAGGGSMVLNASFSNLTSSSSGSVPMGVNFADSSALMAAGFAVSGTMNYGAGTYGMDFSDGSDQFAMAGSGETGGLDFAMSPEGLSYQTRSTGLDLTLSGNTIPLPEVAIKLAEAGFGLTMPMAKSDTPQDVGLLVRMVGLSVGEDIWGMIDPGGALPHDPATLIVDIAGKANWLIDIMAPDAEAQMQAAGPNFGQLHSLDIREVKVAVVGADLSGDGAFTFTPDESFAWGGVLAPEGVLNLTLVGANALLDKLVGMGLIPAEQAMQGRMMMGMVARPGDGPDTLVSTIEVKKEGSVFANGMQLK